MTFPIPFVPTVCVVDPPIYDTIEDVVGIIDARYDGMPATKPNLYARLNEFNGMIYDLRQRNLIEVNAYGPLSEDERYISLIRRELMSVDVQTGVGNFITVRIDDA